MGADSLVGNKSDVRCVAYHRLQVAEAKELQSVASEKVGYYLPRYRVEVLLAELQSDWSERLASRFRAGSRSEARLAAVGLQGGSRSEASALQEKARFVAVDLPAMVRRRQNNLSSLSDR
jgi:hypothetical protein